MLSATSQRTDSRVRIGPDNRSVLTEEGFDA